MADVLSNLKSLTNTASSLVGTLRVADKEVQTEFPASLLEDYVVNNRKRILKLLGFTNATANNPRDNKFTSAISLNSPRSRPQTLQLHSSWNPLPKTSVKIEKETKPMAPSINNHPLRNLYVSNTTHSMDCPIISVEECDDNGSNNSPPLRLRGRVAKRHSSTGDALEMYRGNLQLQKRLRDLEKTGSKCSLGSNHSQAPITDF